MIFHKTSTIILTILIVMILLASCSHSSNSSSPIEPSIDIADLPVESESSNVAGRNPIAVYEALIDPDAKMFTITPVTRGVQYHYPLTELFPNCLQVVDYGYEPNFWADIKLVHPVQGTGIDFFDPRVIAIVPAHWDAYFHYPSLGVYGNPKVLLEPDGYTKLFNELASDIFGNVNPFVAYFKDVPYRRWSSTGQTEETKRWEMELDGFGGPVQFDLVVDVSTNFPNQPYPVMDNMWEPVEIKALVGSGLTSDGGNAIITVDLFDWQGMHTIGEVNVEAPDLFNGYVALQYSKPGENQREFTYSGIIANEKLAPIGEYSYLVSAKGKISEINLYQEFTVKITEYCGNLEWATRAGGEWSDLGRAVTILSDNSILVTGKLGGIYIARYITDGTLIWDKNFGGGLDTGLAITSLSDDSAVITGYFTLTTTFGEGEPNEVTLTSDGSTDVFIARYNSDGTLLWAKQAGGKSSSNAYSITALTDDSVVISGYFRDQITFGKDEPYEAILNSAGSDDIFTARYNSDGTLRWAKRAGGTGEDRNYGVTSLSDNSIVATGAFRDTATFGEGEPNETILTSAGGSDIFIARYNPDGMLQWAKRAGGTNWNRGSAITTLSNDLIAVTGYFQGTAIFGEGEPNETVFTSITSSDTFIAWYNSDGTLQLAKQVGGRSSSASSITTLSDGRSIVITGGFSYYATFGMGEPNETTLTGLNGGIYIARYNPDGTLEWAKSAGSLFGQASSAITALMDDSTVIVGNFSHKITFGVGEPNETTLTSAGSSDIFIARYKP